MVMVRRRRRSAAFRSARRRVGQRITMRYAGFASLFRLPGRISVCVRTLSGHAGWLPALVVGERR